MKYRDFDFQEGGIYHTCNRSISRFIILQNPEDVERFINLIEYCNKTNNIVPYSTFNKDRQRFFSKGVLHRKDNQVVSVIAYCIMPDHYHLLLKSNVSNIKFSTYMSRIENSFAKYFNQKIYRKGPLWQSRFRAVQIENNEQLLHVSRYIHLNPTTKKLVSRPEDWEKSSYKEYLKQEILDKITEISITDSNRYRKFVEDRKNYQISLKKIKKLLLEK